MCAPTMGVKMDIALLFGGIKCSIGSNAYCNDDTINTQQLKPPGLAGTNTAAISSNTKDAHSDDDSNEEATVTSLASSRSKGLSLANTSHASRTTTGSSTWNMSSPRHLCMPHVPPFGPLALQQCTLKKVLIGKNEGVHDELQLALTRKITQNPKAKTSASSSDDSNHDAPLFLPFFLYECNSYSILDYQLVAIEFSINWYRYHII
jgi:hypothetical protein